VTPRTQTTLIPEVSGEIVEVSPYFISGGFFSKGDILVKIDPSNYETALKRANAAVKRAETQVATENALAGYAAQDWQRLRSLNATDTPASDLTLRKPQLAEALAGLESAEADREKAMRDLSRTNIRAPYDGMVREKRADIGQFVTSGTQLAQTFATDFAEVRLPLTQKDLQYINLPRTMSDRPLAVSLKAELGGKIIEWSAQVVRSEGVFDETRRVLYAVAQIIDPYANQTSDREPLRIGTFVTAEVEGVDAGELFVIPRTSLSRGTTLWVVDKQSKIYPQTLDIVRSDRNFAYVSGGIDEGMSYCVTPPSQALPGMMVRMDG
jgi:RND family efflux transporter MFP subunit